MRALMLSALAIAGCTQFLKASHCIVRNWTDPINKAMIMTCSRELFCFLMLAMTSAGRIRRCTGALLLVALLYYPGSIACPSDWSDRFLREAQPAWQQYIDNCNSIEGTVQRTVQFLPSGKQVDAMLIRAGPFRELCPAVSKRRTTKQILCGNLRSKHCFSSYWSVRSGLRP